MNNPLIAIVSTYTTDRLLDGKTGEIIREQPGGPAYFMEKALQNLDVNFKLYTGEKILSIAKLFGNDEVYKIKSYEQPLPFPHPATDVTIFSPIIHEWLLDGIKDYKGRIFFDVHGAVRSENEFRKEIWHDAGKYAPYIFCIKANESELAYLPPEVVADQKANRMMLSTLGSKGIEIVYKGQTTLVKPQKVKKLLHTIGAGDMLLIHFAIKFSETENVGESGAFAIEKTTEFLETIQ